MSEPRQGKKEPKAELDDLLEQRRTLRNRLADDTAREAFQELTSRIVALKKQLNTI